MESIKTELALNKEIKLKEQRLCDSFEAGECLPNLLNFSLNELLTDFMNMFFGRINATISSASHGIGVWL